LLASAEDFEAIAIQIRNSSGSKSAANRVPDPQLMIRWEPCVKL